MRTMMRKTDHVEELAAVRGEITRELDAAAAEERAPVPREDALARIDEHIAARGREALVRGAAYASSGFDAQYLGTLIAGELDAVLALIAPDHVRAVLVADVDNHLAQHAPGPPAAERAARQAARTKRLLALVVREETSCRDAEEHGTPIVRRNDAPVPLLIAADVRAVDALETLAVSAIDPDRVRGYVEDARRLHVIERDVDERACDAAGDVSRRAARLERLRDDEARGRYSRREVAQEDTPGIGRSGTIDVLQTEAAALARDQARLDRLRGELVAARDAWNAAAQLAERVTAFLRQRAPHLLDDEHHATRSFGFGA